VFILESVALTRRGEAVVLQIELKVIDCVLLTAQKKGYFVVYEFKLPRHLFIDIINLVH